MIYRILFNPAVSFDNLEYVENCSDVYKNAQTGSDSIEYMGFEIELIMSFSGEIGGLQFVNQCTRTSDAEYYLIDLSGKLINKNTMLELHDGTGFSDTISAAEFLDTYQ